MNFFNIVEYSDIEKASIDVQDGMEANIDANVLILYVWWLKKTLLATYV